MQWDETPDRRIGLITGMVSGVIGVAAMRYYVQHIEPRVLPELFHSESESPAPVYVAAPVQQPESATEAVGRVIYTNLSGVKPLIESARALDELMQWLYGIAMGGTYGGTRTTTAPRDLAGGFFYGIRLWIGDTVLLNLLLRRNLTTVPVQEHLRRLLQIWVFSFITTAITRILYRVIV